METSNQNQQQQQSKIRSLIAPDVERRKELRSTFKEISYYLLIGIISICVVAFLAKGILKKDAGDDRMKEISGYIEEGAMAFLKKEYSYLAVFILVVALATLLFLSYKTAFAFVVGAVFSIVAGYVGMRIAVKANVRTAQAAKNGIKDAPAGQKFYRTITDDTIPGGPVERTIEYVAPFDRCDREQDYEIAWKFFEEKYGGQA